MTTPTLFTYSPMARLLISYHLSYYANAATDIFKHVSLSRVTTHRTSADLGLFTSLVLLVITNGSPQYTNLHPRQQWIRIPRGP